MNRAIVAVALGVLTAACGGPDTSQAPQPKFDGVVGSVSKGPLQGATVNFYQVDVAGNLSGTTLATVSTDSSGRFSVTGLPSGVPILVQTGGGSYLDESDPHPDPAQRRRIVFGANERLEAVLPAGASTLAITPYSMALLQKARTQAAGANFAAVYAAVHQQAQAAFGFDPILTQPADPITGAGGSQAYGILLGAAALTINQIAVTGTPEHLPGYADVIAFVNDFADGQLTAANLDDMIRRFRNNNIGVYGGTSAPVVNETMLREPAPVPNQAPTISDVVDQVTSEGVATAALGFTVGDAETAAGALTVTASSGNTTLVPNGNIALGGTGASRTVTVTPAAGQSGSATITLTVTDADSGTASDSFVLTVSAVNDPPVFTSNIPTSATEDTLYTYMAAVSDPDGPAPTWSTTASDTCGGTIDAAGVYTFTPAGPIPAASCVVAIQASDGGTPVAQSATVAITAVNDPPIAVDDAAATNEDVSVNIAGTALASNDSDADGPGLTVTAVANPVNGAVSLTSGIVTFTPAPDFFGTASFEYTVSDGVATDTGLVTVTVSPVNDAPSFTVPVSAPAVNEDAGAQTVTLFATGISAGPGEGTQALAFNLLGNTNPALFSAGPAIASNGTLTYTAAANASGSATITVSLSDDGGTANGGVDTSGTQSFVITVNPVNDPPTISTFGGGSIPEDTNTGSLDYTIGDGETPAASLTFSAVSSNTTLVPNTNFDYTDDGDGDAEFRDLTITPAPDQYGSTTITVTVTDGGGATATDVFVLTVDPVSDAPSSQTFGIQTDQDLAYVFGTAEFNFSDATDSNGDGSDVDSFAAVLLTSLPGNGLLVLNDGTTDNPITALPFPPIATSEIVLGHFKFVPDPGESGIPYASFNFQVQDDGSTANGGQIVSIPYALNVDVLPTTPPPETALPFLTAAGELKLFDPANPTSPILLESGIPATGIEARTLLRASVTGGVASDVRPARLVYIRDNAGIRTLWKVNLEPGQSRTPVQVSNIANACQINGVAEDLANPDNSLMRIDTAGGNGTCDNGGGDDNTAPAQLVPLSTSGTAPGIPIGLGHCCGLVGLGDASGAITGVLVTEDDGTGSTFELRRRNVGSLGTATPIATLQIAGTGSIFASETRGMGDQNVYLRVRRDTDATYKLLRFNADNSLTEVYDFGVADAGSLGGDFDGSTYDLSDFFFASANGQEIIKVPHTATGPGLHTVLAAGPAGYPVARFEQAGDRIVFEVEAPVSGGVYSVPKATGGVTTLALDDAAPTFVSLAGISGDRVFINAITGSVPDFVAKSVQADGQNAQADLLDAQWGGESYQTTCDLNADCEASIAAQAVFLRRGAGGSLADIELVDPVSGAPTGKLFPQVINVNSGQSMFAGGFGRYAQVTFFSVAGNTDVWLADTAAASPAAPAEAWDIVSADPGGDDQWLTFGSEQGGGAGGTDSDGDGLTDAQEAALGTNPNVQDTDGDGLTDFDEVDNDGNPGNYTPGIDTDPTNPDTDGDGLGDGEETFQTGTSAASPDTDGDGASDGIELLVGSDAVSTTNVVIYANAFCSGGCDGTSWATGYATQGEILAAIDGAGGGGIDPASTLYVLYAPGTYEPLALTDTARTYIALVGSLGEGVHQLSFPPTTTFDAAGAGPAFRVADVVPLTVAAIGFTGGNNPQGGGVMLDVMAAGVELYMHRVHIHNNTAENGGGLALLGEQGTFDDYVEMTDSLVEFNSAVSTTLAAAGGGLYMTDGSLTLRNTRVVDNTADGTNSLAQGGGLHVAGALGVAVHNSEFNRNRAFNSTELPASGGGIYVGGTTFADFYMEYSRVLGNSTTGAIAADSGGAGMFVGTNARAFVTTSLFADNKSAGGPGGGVNAIDSPDVTVEHSQFLSNSSTRPGGGLHVHVPSSGLATTFNNLFVGNVASDTDADGGAIEIENIGAPAGTVRIESNTIAYNQVPNNPDVGPLASGGGISVFSANSADTFRNNIAWFNDNGTVDDPLTPEDGDNLFFDTPLAESGNNVNEATFGGNSIPPDDPLFRSGFYLDPGSSSVEAGDALAGDVFVSAFAAPYTTDPSGAEDTGIVDIGFHHILGKAAPDLAVGLDVFAQFGSPVCTVFMRPKTASGDLGAGHLVAVDSLAGVGALSAITTLDPMRTSTSRLAQDQGDGVYRIQINSAEPGSYTAVVYVDGGEPLPAAFDCL